MLNFANPDMVGHTGVFEATVRAVEVVDGCLDRIERAVLAFVEPRLLTTEKEFVAKNTFQVAYKPFDWTLNDLTGRGGR